MSWSGFGELDLSKVEQSEGSQRLAVGNYTVKCTSAKVESFGDKEQHKRVVADFQDVGGSGDIRFNFNVHHTNDQTVEIGLRQLKSFLLAGGHPTPDNPSDVTTLVGLSCDVYVGMGKPWKGTDGNERQQTEIKSFKPSGGGDKEGKSGGTAKKLDDEIPF